MSVPYGQVFIRRKKASRKHTCGHPFRRVACITCCKVMCPRCSIMTNNRCQRCTNKRKKVTYATR